MQNWLEMVNMGNDEKNGKLWKIKQSLTSQYYEPKSPGVHIHVICKKMSPEDWIAKNFEKLF